MNNNNNEVDNKVVYINDDEEQSPSLQEMPPVAAEEVTVEDTLVTPEMYNTTIVEEGDDEDEYEDYNTSSKEDILLDLNNSGYESDGGMSDNDSIATDDILRVDPLYMRLTKFLATDDGESVASTLKKINEQLVALNANLSNRVP
jgi:hypothetical protein